MARPLHEIYLAVSTREHPDVDLCARDRARLVELLREYSDDLRADGATTIPAALRWLAWRGVYSPTIRAQEMTTAP